MEPVPPEKKDDYSMVRVTNNSEADEYQQLTRLLQLPENQPIAGWDPQGRMPSKPDEMLFVLLDGNRIIATFEIVVERSKVINLDVVNISPAYTGQKLCKSFLKRILQYFLALGHTEFKISVFSSFMDGIPACLCYYRAASEMGLEIFYQDTQTDAFLPLPTEITCLEKETNQMDLKFIM